MLLDMDRKYFARWLKQTRTSKGFSLKELGQRSGISASALSKVENAKMSLTYDKLMLLVLEGKIEHTEHVYTHDTVQRRLYVSG